MDMNKKGKHMIHLKNAWLYLLDIMSYIIRQDK